MFAQSKSAAASTARMEALQRGSSLAPSPPRAPASHSNGAASSASEAPHSNRGLSAPVAADNHRTPLTNKGVPASVLAERALAEALANPSDQWRNPPKCRDCGKVYLVCGCDEQEPQQEHFRPALNRDVDWHWVGY